MSTRQLRTAAFCEGCGHVSYYTISFDVIESQISQEMYTRPGLEAEPLRVYCEKCKRKMVNCDVLIAQQLSDLNQLGYRTTHSCEGHWRRVVHIAVDKETKERKLIDDYELSIPYVQFSRTMSLDRLHRLYDISNLVITDYPNWDLEAKLQIVCIGEQSHRKEVHTIVPKSDEFWKRPLADMNLRIGPPPPMVFKNLKPGERIDYDVGCTISLKMTQDFNQFLTELVSRLSKI